MNNKFFCNSLNAAETFWNTSNLLTRQTHSTMKTAIKVSSVDEGLGGVLFNYSLGCCYNEP
jgi:hypothetical protein